MTRLPRCLRLTRALNEDPALRSPQPRDFWSVNGVKSHSVWSPPTPHTDLRVTLGEDPHRAVHRDYTERPATLAEQIADLVARSYK
jgi:hypothetical protein